MNRKAGILVLASLLAGLSSVSGERRDSLLVQGQLSSWTNFNPDLDAPWQAGVRYLPQLNLIRNLGGSDRKIDLEASANLYGSLALHPFSTRSMEGRLKPYRAWVRYSTSQLELRLGLQKINFGSSTLLRPLMWFDKLDPRDPLQLTDGVWGLLGRYYFTNNANLWLWGLYGTPNAKTWETGATSQHAPEFGGRFQQPVPKGEMGLSYHHRTADTRNLNLPVPAEVGENRIGLDGKWDLGVGLWVEGSWMHKNANLGALTNQEVLNAGTDYTFGIGNGLNLLYEQLVFSYDEKPFGFTHTTTFSAVSASYPAGLFDLLSGMVYYDWKNQVSYNFLSWKKQFNNTALYLMAYRNPKDYRMPQQAGTANLFAGTGVQVLFVYNH